MRAEMPLVLGRGLDRETGIAGVQPQYPDDARNVYAKSGKMALAPGMQATGFPALPWGTHVLDIATVKATLEVLYVVFDSDSLEIRVFRLNQETGVLSPLTTPADGLWGTLNIDADFPVVQHAEADGLMFFAHAEDDIAFRLNTVYYEPDPSSVVLVGTLNDLLADLDGDDVEALVYFSGVYAYLEYMWGWGYGSEEVGNEDRGDVIRFAKPGQPLVWLPGNYLLAGVRKDPIIDVISTDDILAVMKGDEMYRLTGTSPADFGIFLMDAEYGTIAARVSWNTGGRAYTWSNDGGRRVTRDGTIPFAQPLDLTSPLPETFPALGPPRLAFAAYDQTRYLLYFVFPDIEAGSVPVPAFLLSLENPDDPRWTYREIQQPVTCAGVLITRDTGGSPPAPDGYVSDITAEDIP